LEKYNGCLTHETYFDEIIIPKELDRSNQQLRFWSWCEIAEKTAPTYVYYENLTSSLFILFLPSRLYS